MSPKKKTTSPQRPSRGKSATGVGYFGILGEVVGVLLALFVGYRFLTVENQPDLVAWISFGIGVVLFIDMIRRIWIASTRGLED